nr:MULTISPECIES: hypothetical protein [Enterobacterales]
MKSFEYSKTPAIGDKPTEVCKWIDKAAIETDKTVLTEFFKWKNNGVPAGNG